MSKINVFKRISDLEKTAIKQHEINNELVRNDKSLRSRQLFDQVINSLFLLILLMVMIKILDRLKEVNAKISHI